MVARPTEKKAIQHATPTRKRMQPLGFSPANLPIEVQYAPGSGRFFIQTWVNDRHCHGTGGTLPDALRDLAYDIDRKTQPRPEARR